MYTPKNPSRSITALFYVGSVGYAIAKDPGDTKIDLSPSSALTAATTGVDNTAVGIEDLITGVVYLAEPPRKPGSTMKCT
jgi:hypothetical protein